MPYPQTGGNSFHNSSLSIYCSNKGHRATNYSATQSSSPEHTISVSWKNNHLELADGNTYAYISTSGPVPSSPLITMASTPVPSPMTPTMVQVVAPILELSKVLSIHTTPYNSTAWNNALSQAMIYSLFLNLVHNLTYGSPIGTLPH